MRRPWLLRLLHPRAGAAALLAAMVIPAETEGQEVSEAQPHVTLEVRVTGLRSLDGSVRLALFDDEQSFTEAPAHTAVLPLGPQADSGPAVWQLRVTPGTYAVAVVHDRNDNQRLDTNLLGMPTEPYGFSNGARGRLGPPSFSAAAFEVHEGSDGVDVPLR